MSETNTFEELIIMRSKVGDGTIYRQRPLVRCKDYVNNGTSRCPCHYSGDPYIDWNPDDNWFCADGERQ